LPASYQPATFDNGLWLRQPRESIVAKLGQPSGQQGNELTYSYEGQQTAPAPSGNDTIDYDVTSSLVAELQSGFVVRLTASKTSVED
jgi:hypothetical protein